MLNKSVSLILISPHLRVQKDIEKVILGLFEFRNYQIFWIITKRMQLIQADHPIDLKYVALKSERLVRLNFIIEKDPLTKQRYGEIPLRRICRLLELSNPGQQPWDIKVRKGYRKQSKKVIPIYVFWCENSGKDRQRLLKKIKKDNKPKILFLLNLEEPTYLGIGPKNPHQQWDVNGSVIFFAYFERFQPIQQAVFESVLLNWDNQQNVYQQMCNSKEIPIYRPLEELSRSLYLEDIFV